MMRHTGKFYIRIFCVFINNISYLKTTDELVGQFIDVIKKFMKLFIKVSDF